MENFGSRNSKAPTELDRFAFLIGRWQCDARLLVETGNWHQFRAEWIGRYALDGYAVEDEYRMFDAANKLVVLGLNLRSYESAKKKWNIRWLNAFDGAWTDLTSEEFGGAQFHGESLSYAFREPMAQHPYTRATYTPDSESHFTWTGDKSSDGKVWEQFMIVEARRVGGNST